MRRRVFFLNAAAPHRQEPTSRLMEHGKTFKSSNLTMSKVWSNGEAGKYEFGVLLCIN
jgi:hypothetical protein